MTPIMTVLLLSVVVLSTLHAVADASSYDCRRAGQDCMNGGTCSFATGICNCSGTHQGFNCEVATANLAAGCTPPTCNGGICHDSGSGAQCFCPAHLTGASCDKARVRVESCKHDEMVIIADVFGEFDGRIAFMKGSRGNYQHVETSGEENDGCVEDNMMNVIVRGPMDREYRNNRTCVHREDDAPAVGAMTVDIGLSVQYLVDVWGDLDQAFELQCIYEKSGDKVQTMSPVLPTVMPTAVTGMTADISVNFTIVDNAGNTDGPHVKGDQRFLKFDFNVNGVFKNFIVDKCTAHAQPDMAEMPNLLLVKDKCFERAAAPYFKSATRDSGVTPRTIKMDFTVFKFKNNDNVYFTCTVHLCRDEDGDFCVQPACASSAMAFGRRRRSVPDASDNEIVVSHSFKVLDRKN